jgi:hypothetical protein
MDDPNITWLWQTRGGGGDLDTYVMLSLQVVDHLRCSIQVVKFNLKKRVVQESQFNDLDKWPSQSQEAIFKVSGGQFQLTGQIVGLTDT